MSFSAADISRRLENLLCYATVAEVDNAAHLVRLSIGERKTGWLPYPAEIGANFRRWRPLRTGQQVLAACISGDPANAVIVKSLYSDDLPAPSDSATTDTIVFDDGTALTYDSAAHALTAALCSGGTIALTADGGTRIKGPVDIDGPLTVSKSVTADGDVTGGGISLKSHTHKAVKAGTDLSGGPQ